MSYSVSYLRTRWLLPLPSLPLFTTWNHLLQTSGSHAKLALGLWKFISLTWYRNPGTEIKEGCSVRCSFLGSSLHWVSEIGFLFVCLFLLPWPSSFTLCQSSEAKVGFPILSRSTVPLAWPRSDQQPGESDSLAVDLSAGAWSPLTTPELPWLLPLRPPLSFHSPRYVICDTHRSGLIIGLLNASTEFQNLCLTLETGLHVSPLSSCLVGIWMSVFWGRRCFQHLGWLAATEGSNSKSRQSVADRPVGSFAYLRTGSKLITSFLNVVLVSSSRNDDYFTLTSSSNFEKKMQFQKLLNHSNVSYFTAVQRSTVTHQETLFPLFYNLIYWNTNWTLSVSGGSMVQWGNRLWSH